MLWVLKRTVTMRRDGSFEHSKHMLILMAKKILTKNTLKMFVMRVLIDHNLSFRNIFLPTFTGKWSFKCVFLYTFGNVFRSLIDPSSRCYHISPNIHEMIRNKQ